MKKWTKGVFTGIFTVCAATVPKTWVEIILNGTEGEVSIQ